jgi:phosphatidylserine/phosphatidylglycerophosphate/cardiolipin synthase-like enzyme
VAGYLVWHINFRPGTQVYKTAAGLELYFAPQHGREARERLIALMDEAQSRIEVAVMELEDREIGQALTRAAARGVQVRIFTDSDYRRETRESLGVPTGVRAAARPEGDRPTGVRAAARPEGDRPTGVRAAARPEGDRPTGVRAAARPEGDRPTGVRAAARPEGDRPESSRARCETLQQVQVCYDSRNDALMHHKFMLIDQKGVWTGSTNLTWGAFERNNENSLWLLDVGLVQAYRAEFDAIFAGQENDLGRSHGFWLGATEGRVYFSPAGGLKARQAILDLVQRSSHEIWVAAFVLTDRRIVQALTSAHQRGVQVRVVIDGRNLENSREELLGLAGIEVRRDGNPYAMHHKVMVLDREWVVTGSYNFTHSAFGRNNENLLILRDGALAQRYRREVEAIWRAGRPP